MTLKLSINKFHCVFCVYVFGVRESIQYALIPIEHLYLFYAVCGIRLKIEVEMFHEQLYVS